MNAVLHRLRALESLLCLSAVLVMRRCDAGVSTVQTCTVCFVAKLGWQHIDISIFGELLEYITFPAVVFIVEAI